ncbi:MAG: ABC transporter substrate-binding protein [Firmicutes bacterium]|nr:ABC transporter substrate-binding protein [Bacillota bacterium]
MREIYPNKRFPFVEAWRPFFCQQFLRGEAEYKSTLIISDDHRTLTMIADIETVHIPCPERCWIAALLPILAHPIASIMPRHHLEWIPIEELRDHPNMRENIIGSGAFMKESLVPGESITLKSNPNYWLRGPYVGRIVLQIMPRSLMGMAMEAGMFHVGINALSQDYLHLTNCIFAITPSNSPLALLFNFNNTEREENNNPVRIEEFRQAISYAINVSELAQIFSFEFTPREFDGIVEFVNAFPYSFVGVNFMNMFSQFNNHTFDPEYANHLLDLIGFARGSDGNRQDWYGNDLILRIFVENNKLDFPVFETVFHHVMQNLSDIGLRVEVVTGTRHCKDLMFVSDLIFGNFNLISGLNYLTPFLSDCTPHCYYCQPCCCNPCHYCHCTCSIHYILDNIINPLIVLGWNWLSMAVNNSAGGMFISPCADYIDLRFTFLTAPHPYIH